MEEYHQARWRESLLFEKSSEDHKGYSFQSDPPVSHDLPDGLLREDLDLPQLSEPEIVRYFTRLSQMNYGVDSGVYPLGSCTMKYNPRLSEELASMDEVRGPHPDQPIETIQGSLEIMYRLKELLIEITGMDYFTLQPSAGAQGEFTAMKIVKGFHEEQGEDERNEIIVPDSAHGTNPASAKMAGFEVVEVPSTDRGRVDLDALEYAISDETAGMMLTNPNTLGLFEDEIEDLVELIHENGSLLFYDGANLNSILGKVKPGEMGFDLLHLNLHKTFSTPHGGGGPGGGPVGVKEELERYLPTPVVDRDEENQQYYFEENKESSIGRIHPFYGNFEVIVKAYTYIRSMGPEGLKEAAETSVLNANYIRNKGKEIEGFELKRGKDTSCKHEVVFSCSDLESETGVTAADLAKRILDYGVHSPTIYFPTIISESMMIEPTETVSKEELDRYIDAMSSISKEASPQPEKVKSAPHKAAIDRLDEAKAARNPILTWKMYKRKKEGSGGD